MLGNFSSSTWKRRGEIFAFSFLVLLTIGIFFISYSISIVWLLVLLLSWPVWALIYRVTKGRGRWSLVTPAVLILLLFTCLGLWIVLINLSSGVFYGAGPGPDRKGV